ncbi:MAG: single-stranded DNA-binding protein [Calditrichia bacterium]
MAMSLNRAEIIGNVTRDPDIKVTPNGQTVATIGVATNHTWVTKAGEKQEKVEYHNVVVWGKLAEICGKFLNKGSKVFFAGRIQTRDWETKEGQKRKTTEIVASEMLMLDRAGGSNNNAPEPNPEIESGKVDVNDLPF